MQSSSVKRSSTLRRRVSNDLAGSIRIDELRTLQSQLGMLIQKADSQRSIEIENAKDEQVPTVDDIERSISWERNSSEERSALLGSDVKDIESGMSNKSAVSMYKPTKRHFPQESDDALPVVHRTAHHSKRTIHRAGASPDSAEVSPAPLTSPVALDQSRTRTGSEISDMTAKSVVSCSDTNTVDTAGSGSKTGTTTDRRDRFARSMSRARSYHSPGRPRASIFKSRRSNLFAVSDNSGGRKSTSRLLTMPTYDFLQKDDEEKEGGSLRAGSRWWHGVFLFSLIGMLACIITLWAPYPIGARMPSATVAAMPWSDGCGGGLDACICPRETICADDLLSMIFLTIARCSAWFDYPLYMLLFMSKANNLNNFLQKTALRCWINFSDYHRVHSLFGMIVGIESASHSFFHILRWARRKDDIQLLWTSKTGITGLIAISLIPFIVLPMTVPYLKSRLPFEWRKGLHYLSILWGVALMCHAPQRIFWLIGVPFFIYTADKIAEGLFKTHLIESAHFQRLGDTSCIISFENPPGFGKQNSAYVYLMLPWLSKHQFHAFTVFPCTKPNHSSICIHKSGDWTGKLMKAITTPTHKPAFVVGPFLSPFSSPAMDSENLVAVASGIGVTPAISLIKQYSSTSRRLNLVWICRDAGLVEHFLQNVEFGSDGYTLIYYTGKRSLILRDDLPANVLLFNGRPNLERAISGIITSIATGDGLPEELHMKVLTRTPGEMRVKLLLEKALSIYTIDQLFGYTVKASNHYNEGQEPLVDMVNYQGCLSTLRHLLADDYKSVTDQITENFEKIDTSGFCRLDRGHFEIFFKSMLRIGFDGSDTEEPETSSMRNVKRGLQRMTTTRDMFESGRKPSGSNEFSSKDEFGIKPYLQGDGKFAAKNWNMLYCGGSQPVLDQLNAFKRKFGIGLSVEKFDW